VLRAVHFCFLPRWRSLCTLYKRHRLGRCTCLLSHGTVSVKKRRLTIPGIAQVSGMQLLAGLSTLPSDLMVREWVAHSGLDPAHEISGSSVRKAHASAAPEIAI
jgi:hypothetical protein